MKEIIGVYFDSFSLTESIVRLNHLDGTRTTLLSNEKTKLTNSQLKDIALIAARAYGVFFQQSYHERASLILQWKDVKNKN